MNLASINGELLWAFIGASVLILIVPGPTTLWIVQYAVRRGPWIALRAAPWVVLADGLLMLAAFLGLGVLLQMSAELFWALQTVGGGYLLYLGVQTWRRTGKISTSDSAIERPVTAFWITILNPKAILFFMAFMPAFVRPQEPIFGQALVLMAIFLTLSGINSSAYALLGGYLGQQLTSDSAQRRLDYVSSGVFLLLGFSLLLSV